ncbi:MAG: hypothetical protein IPP94_14430 [Ignavibacteria bacterium]|nr:hypothetical protein [Ignavibacteria bacterium]
MIDERPRENAPARSTDPAGLFGAIEILVHWRRFLLINALIVTVLVSIVLILMPNTYKSTASVIPPKQEAGLGGALSQITKDLIPSALMGKLGASQGTYNYLAILESRRTMEAVVKKFDLTTVYGISSGSMEKTIKALNGNVLFDIEKNGNIVLSVVDESPQRAADMANFFVAMLNEVNTELGSQEARSNREFLEKRFAQARSDMRAAEDTLTRFQERYGIYALPEQLRAAIQEVAQLRAQASISEVELGILERSLGRDNPQTRLKESEIRELHTKLRQMKSGNAESYTKDDLSFFVPFKDVPELGLQYLRLYRDFEIQTKMLQFIIPLYEQARVDEQKNIPAVLVLDRGIPPERKDGPKRMTIGLAALFGSLFFFSMLALLLESFRTRSRVPTAMELRLRGGIDRLARRYGVRTPAE